MTATTDILPFATAPGALVESQGAYAGSSVQLDGFQIGVADPSVLNKVWRQSAFMAAGLANFIVAQGISVPDDGNLTNLVTEITQALVYFITSGATGPVSYVQIYNGNPNGHVAGTVGSAGTVAPSMVWDSAENVLWVCTTTGTTSTAVWSRQSLMQVYAGNPNGNVAGTQGIAGGASPSMVWDSTNNILWICTTTGNAASAVWSEVGGSNTTWPFWCGTSTGTGNAQVVTTPSVMQAFPVGAGVSWQIGASNTGATTLQVGSFGTFTILKDGPTGPVALAEKELIAGNIAHGRRDSNGYIQLTATEMGTAALKNTGTTVTDPGSGALEVAFPGAPHTGANYTYQSADRGYTIRRSNAGAAMTDTLPAGMANGWSVSIINIDASAVLTASAPGGTSLNGTNGGSLSLAAGQTTTIEADESGNLWATVVPVPKLVAGQKVYINSSQAIGPGGYLVDTSGGPITLTLPASPSAGDNYDLEDFSGTWGTNPVTINPNGRTFEKLSGNFIANTNWLDLNFALNGAATDYGVK